MNNDKLIKSGERFMPCLLNRLTDREPHQRVERYSRSMTAVQLKHDILRNIEMILNSKSRMSDFDLDNDDALVTSVLGFGMPDFCGESQSDESMERLKSNIIKQLVNFEPRINPSSVEVRIIGKSDGFNYVCDIEILGIVEIASLAGELAFKSSLDLETGTISVKFEE